MFAHCLLAFRYCSNQMREEEKNTEKFIFQVSKICFHAVESVSMDDDDDRGSASGGGKSNFLILLLI